MKTNDLMDNSMFIVLSDHGEYFGDHLDYKAYNQTFRCKGTVHPPFLFNTSIHVPLVLSIPGIKSIKFEENISSIDLFPTILDFLNIRSIIPMQGINLIPYLKGKNYKKDRYIFSSYQDDERLATSVIQREYKLIKYYLIRNGVYHPYETEFIDLKNNPHENGPSSENNVKKHLEEILKIFLDYQLKYIEKHNLFQTNLGVKTSNLKNLKSLGYLK